MAIINQNADQNKVDIYKDGNLILQYTDTLNSNDTFVRELGANTYHYTSDGEIQLLQVTKATRFIKRTKKNRTFNEKFLTLDIETRVISNVHKPYLISFYDGKESLSFYLSDYSSVNEMFEDAILSLCRAKYHRHKVYIHNLASFDGIFLLKYLSKIGIVKPLINNGRIIQFQLEYFEPNRDYSIILDFRDSYQILLASLKRLSKSFNTETQKSIFPYRFANNHNLDYNAKVPALRYFDDISIEEYNSYCDNLSHSWNLRNESIKYCVTDCIALYQVIDKFNQILFDEFSININEHPTISSHARRVFCTHFLEENTIPMIYGEDYRKLKLSYTGGATDMYIPANDKGELVYGYDVNSLYPYIMANFLMPVGSINYFEGDIRKYQLDAFGFFYCKNVTPDNLPHPILHTHVKTKAGLRTIAGIGTYHDMIFSHSYDNAIKAGYKIEIL
jgi:DNA polymerase family B